MNTLDCLAVMLTDQVQHQQLTNLEFRDPKFTVNLEHLLSLSGLDEHLYTPESVRAAVESYGACLTQKKRSPLILEELLPISQSFATALNRSYDELKSLHAVVDKLVQSTNVRVNDTIAADPALAATMAEPKTTKKLPTVQWRYLNRVSERDNVTRLHASLKLESDAPTTGAIIDQLLDRLPYASTVNTPAIESVALTAPKAKQVVAQLQAQLKDQLDPAIVKSIFVNLMDFNTYQCHRAVNQLKEFGHNYHLESINKMLRMVDAYNQVIPALTPELMDVAPSTYAQIKRNMDTMQQYIDMTTYLCSYYRNQVWKDAVLVPGGQINTDNWADFCTVLEKPANPVVAILQHEHAFYQDQPIPTCGVTIRAIKDRAENIDKLAREEASANTLKLNQEKRAILQQAFTATACEWLQQQKQFSPEFAYAQQPEVFANSVYNANTNGSLENMFYTVILNSTKYNTLCYKLHDQLKQAYTKKVAGVENLSPADLTQVEMGVVAKMISDFLVDHLVA